MALGTKRRIRMLSRWIRAGLASLQDSVEPDQPTVLSAKEDRGVPKLLANT
jgi:hypothetical protein